MTDVPSSTLNEPDQDEVVEKAGDALGHTSIYDLLLEFLNTHYNTTNLNFTTWHTPQPAEIMAWLKKKKNKFNFKKKQPEVSNGLASCAR